MQVRFDCVMIDLIFRSPSDPDGEEMTIMDLAKKYVETVLRMKRSDVCYVATLQTSWLLLQFPTEILRKHLRAANLLSV